MSPIVAERSKTSRAASRLFYVELAPSGTRLGAPSALIASTEILPLVKNFLASNDTLGLG
jgi:hypothetical protein